VVLNLENRSAQRASVGKLKEREEMEKPKVDIGVILEWIL
jgi:hypothetical protein